MQTVSPPAKPADSPAGLTPLALAGTLSARICHDLAGSLGALTGTLEMAAEDHDQNALRLSVSLALELAARLRLLRAAWGADTELPSLDSLQPGFPGAERLSLDTTRLAASDERVRRLALSLMLAATPALPRGGTLRIAGTNTGLVLDIEGPRAAWHPVLVACAASEAALLDACESPRAMAVALSCLQARALGWSIAIESESRLRAA